MASRPHSHSSHPIIDVRAFEEKRCFSKNALTMIIQHLHRCLETIPREKSYIQEAQIWLELRDAFAFMFLFLTGLRRFEFCACTCGDVDLTNGKLFTIGKGNISDFVPLSDQAIVLLREWLDLKKAKGESIKPEFPLFCATGAEGGFLSFPRFACAGSDSCANCTSQSITGYTLPATQQACSFSLKPVPSN